LHLLPHDESINNLKKELLKERNKEEKIERNFLMENIEEKK
jgi:hypothetical protein